MASGPFIIPDKAKLNIASPTGLLDPAKTFKLTLHTSVMAPAPATMEVYADLTNELATANGYTVGGLALTGVTLAQAAGVVKFTSAAAVFTAAGGSIPAWRYGVVRAVGTFNGKIDPIVAYFLGDSTPADIPPTTAGNTLTVTPNAAGMLTVS